MPTAKKMKSNDSISTPRGLRVAN